MSAALSPPAPRYVAVDADDPFKKYWWAILVGLAATALWLLSPMLGDTPVGSAVVDAGASAADENVEQTLASEALGGVDLSMDDAVGKKAAQSPLGFTLAQALSEGSAVAAGATSGSASGSTLAGALKAVSESGGWGERARRGFNAAKLAGGSLSGLGAASAGGSGFASGTRAFGSSNARVGFERTQGLSGGSAAGEAPNAKAVAALRAASARSLLAAGDLSGDGARSSLSRAFDGAKDGSRIGGGAGEASGAYAALDAAPVNLKLDDPKLNEKKLEPPPGVDAGSSAMQDSDMAKQIALQMAGAVLGAVIGGPVGGAVTQVVMQTVERQADQEEKKRQAKQQEQENAMRKRLGLSVQTDR